MLVKLFFCLFQFTILNLIGGKIGISKLLILIANKLVKYCNAGDYQRCYKELYSPKIESVEADGSSVIGFKLMAEKGKEWSANIEKFYWAKNGAPTVSGNWFTVPMSMKIKWKGQDKPVVFEEIGLYQVKNKKIVLERFFYDE